MFKGFAGKTGVEPAPSSFRSRIVALYFGVVSGPYFGAALPFCYIPQVKRPSIPAHQPRYMPLTAAAEHIGLVDLGNARRDGLRPRRASYSLGGELV